MKHPILSCIALLSIASTAQAAPTVSGNLISWPDDGWYQVQDESDYREVCAGGTECTVRPGSYQVINHSTGERFANIVVSTNSGLGNASGGGTGSVATEVSVSGGIIRWPDDGWYQVLDEANYSEVCSGGMECAVRPGSYLVVNHTSGERFPNLEVNSGGELVSGEVDVSGNTIAMPGDGWFQVQNASTYESLCQGISTCTVPDGEYVVINHTSGERFDNIQVPSAAQNTNPINQAKAQVEFQITVPAYQSNELQVRLIWGDVDITAQWIGDESWVVRGELPQNTEHLLTITFFDRNGGLELASYEQRYRTSASDTEIRRIAVDEFNSQKWDTDGDGISNLEESIRGLDPLLNGDFFLSLQDSEQLHFSILEANRSENRTQKRRPYNFSIETNSSLLASEERRGTASANSGAFDSEGNGFLFNYRRNDTPEGLNETTLSSTRTNTGSSIRWETSDIRVDDATAMNSSTTSINEVSIIDETTRSYVGTSYHLSTLFETLERVSISAVYNLVGKRIPDSDECEFISGTVEVSGLTRYEDIFNGGFTSTTSRQTISRGKDNLYWSVTDTVDGALVEEFLVRELFDENTTARFVCEFVDF